MWELADLPTRKYVIRCKWVYLVKVNFDGVAKLKTRLVCQRLCYELWYELPLQYFSCC